MRKSDIIWSIANLIKLNVIKYNDLEGFRDELKQVVKFNLIYKYNKIKSRYVVTTTYLLFISLYNQHIS